MVITERMLVNGWGKRRGRAKGNYIALDERVILNCFLVSWSNAWHKNVQNVEWDGRDVGNPEPRYRLRLEETPWYAIPPGRD